MDHLPATVLRVDLLRLIGRQLRLISHREAYAVVPGEVLEHGADDDEGDHALGVRGSEKGNGEEDDDEK